MLFQFKSLYSLKLQHLILVAILLFPNLIFAGRTSKSDVLTNKTLNRHSSNLYSENIVLEIQRFSSEEKKQYSNLFISEIIDKISLIRDENNRTRIFVYLLNKINRFNSEIFDGSGKKSSWIIKLERYLSSIAMSENQIKFRTAYFLSFGIIDDTNFETLLSTVRMIPIAADLEPLFMGAISEKSMMNSRQLNTFLNLVRLRFDDRYSNQNISYRISFYLEIFSKIEPISVEKTEHTTRIVNIEFNNILKTLNKDTKWQLIEKGLHRFLKSKNNVPKFEKQRNAFFDIFSIMIENLKADSNIDSEADSSFLIDLVNNYSNFSSKELPILIDAMKTLEDKTTLIKLLFSDQNALNTFEQMKLISLATSNRANSLDINLAFSILSYKDLSPDALLSCIRSIHDSGKRISEDKIEAFVRNCLMHRLHSRKTLKILSSIADERIQNPELKTQILEDIKLAKTIEDYDVCVPCCTVQ